MANRAREYPMYVSMKKVKIQKAERVKDERYVVRMGMGDDDDMMS